MRNGFVMAVALIVGIALVFLSFRVLARPSATTGLSATVNPTSMPSSVTHLPLLSNPAAATPVPGSQIPHFSHVFIIVMENEAYEQIIGNTGSAPYINSLAQQYAVAANYYGTTHPSLPNYISMISGDTQGITSNCTTCFIDAPTIVDQL